MLIKALCDYYDVKKKNSSKDNTDEYFSKQAVSYMIFLNITGEITSILDIRREEKISYGKNKTKTLFAKREICLPKRSQKPGIDLNIIEHRPLYIFGLNYDKDNGFLTHDRTQKAEKSHKIFVEGNLEFLEGLNSEIVVAYRNFLLNWNPEEETENSYLVKICKDYESSGYCFALDGDERILLHEDQELIDKYISQKQTEELENLDAITAVCPIEGKELPVARIHEKIKGIRGGNPTGGILVGVKFSAFESFGKTQAYNSCISETAMKKYTSVLNNLLANPKHRVFIGEMSLVFFAIDSNDDVASDFFADALSGREDEILEKSLSAVGSEMSQGRAGDISALQTNDYLVFYVVGLTPNSSRISQKFIIKNNFGKIMDNLREHQSDLQVLERSKQVPLWKLTNELTPPKARDQNVPAPLLSAVIISMLNGTNYPSSLLETVIRRVKTDSDEEKNHFIKLNETRASIIKACLNRKARLMNKKEEITMSLDLCNQNPAYLCGRLFAVLEYIQQRSSGGGLNRTIKDSYFSSACARPATVFPKLVMLAQHHLAKLDGTIYFDKLLASIMALMSGEFPQTLSLDDQGKFIIGYYQQNNALYTKKSDKQEAI